MTDARTLAMSVKKLTPSEEAHKQAVFNSPNPKRNIMYATKQQLLDLIGILQNSCTKDDDSTAPHCHDLFDNVDQDRLEVMRIELENEIAEQPTNPETK
jgi:hypothetical protein